LCTSFSSCGEVFRLGTYDALVIRRQHAVASVFEAADIACTVTDFNSLSRNKI
jgi:hypothetical protein